MQWEAYRNEFDGSVVMFRETEGQAIAALLRFDALMEEEERMADDGG
jgi:hypothetical protein